MPTTTMGLGIDVYPLALGGSTFGWTSDETTSRQVLDSFLDAGGNLIDTSDSYSAFAPGNSGGESETIIGAWIVLEDIAREHRVTLAAVALAWLRGRPGVAAPIASARTVGQLTSMMATTRFELTAAQRSALDDVSPRVPAA